MIMKFAKAPWRATGIIPLAAALACLARPAAAVEMGFYMAGDYGKTRFDRSASAFDATLQPFLACYFAPADDYFCDAPADVQRDQPSRIGKKSKGIDFWVGYQFTHWFAVEGAFLDTGRIRHVFTGSIDRGPVDTNGDNSPDFDGPTPLVTRTTFHTRGAAFAAVGNLEVGEYLSFDLRAGFLFADNKAKVEFSFPETGEKFRSYSSSDGKTPIFYGASANFWISPYFAVRGGVNASSRGAFSKPLTQYFAGIRYSYGY
jgi:hypothetical protein